MRQPQGPTGAQRSALRGRNCKRTLARQAFYRIQDETEANAFNFTLKQAGPQNAWRILATIKPEFRSSPLIDYDFRELRAYFRGYQMGYWDAKA